MSYFWGSAWGMSWGLSWGQSWGPIHEVDEQPSAGAGHPSGIWWGETKIKRGKRLDDVLKKAMERIISGEVEIQPETIAAKAVEIVKPFIEEQKSAEPVIDWKAVESDLKKVKALLKLWQEQMDALEDEEMILIMLAIN